VPKTAQPVRPAEVPSQRRPLVRSASPWQEAFGLLVPCGGDVVVIVRRRRRLYIASNDRERDRGGDGLSS
jgi:hypothetical protein